MRVARLLYNALYGGLALVFALCGAGLLVFALAELWTSVDPRAAAGLSVRVRSILETIGLATIGVASVELSQTVLEEEVLREVPTSAPTRVRRFLSRFLVVVVVSLAIECLVGVFVFLHDEPARLLDVSFIGLAAAALLVSWGVFVRQNEHAERLEPEAMERTKQEDRKVEE